MRTALIAVFLLVLCLALTPFALAIGLLGGIIEGVKPTIDLWRLLANTIRGYTEDPPPCL